MSTAVCHNCHRIRCDCTCPTFILRIPMSIDQELLSIAEKAAGDHSDPLLLAKGWTRFEYVDAIHNRLRATYREMRAAK
jgi:hypothetical protein